MMSAHSFNNYRLCKWILVPHRLHRPYVFGALVSCSFEFQDSYNVPNYTSTCLLSICNLILAGAIFINIQALVINNARRLNFLLDWAWLWYLSRLSENCGPSDSTSDPPWLSSCLVFFDVDSCGVGVDLFWASCDGGVYILWTLYISLNHQQLSATCIWSTVRWTSSSQYKHLTVCDVARCFVSRNASSFFALSDSYVSFGVDIGDWCVGVVCVSMFFVWLHITYQCTHTKQTTCTILRALFVLCVFYALGVWYINTPSATRNKK